MKWLLSGIMGRKCLPSLRYHPPCPPRGVSEIAILRKSFEFAGQLVVSVDRSRPFRYTEFYQSTDEHVCLLRNLGYIKRILGTPGGLELCSMIKRYTMIRWY